MFPFKKYLVGSTPAPPISLIRSRMKWYIKTKGWARLGLEGWAPKMVLKLPQYSIFLCFPRMVRRKYCRSLDFINYLPPWIILGFWSLFWDPTSEFYTSDQNSWYTLGSTSQIWFRKGLSNFFRRILNGLKHLFVAIHTVYITFWKINLTHLHFQMISTNNKKYAFW